MDKPLHSDLFSSENNIIPEGTDKVAMLPSKSVIRNILNFSKALKVEPSKQLGHITYLMN